ncbi:MAG: hypothetical protein GTN40_01305 [Candidatus Aenigmarchaeota archaeon]|nr:hypothetical protein [Candidatus Aenigmarchaeota archaeon]
MIRRRRQFSRGYQKTARVGPVSLGFITVVLLFILSLLYLAQSNRIAVRGYEISELEKKQTELIEERERLEIEAARLKSIQEIQKGASNSKMEPTKQINYVEYTSDIVRR